MTHKEVSGMRQAERMAVGGEDEDEERHEAAATPQHGGGEEQERAEAAQTSTRAADLQKGVTVNRPKRSNRGQPGCMTRRIREGKRLNEVNDEDDGKKEEHGTGGLCGQRQREGQGGARAHDSGRKGVHTTNGESRCGQTDEKHEMQEGRPENLGSRDGQ